MRFARLVPLGTLLLSSLAIAGAKKYLAPIPGVLSFHIGKMVPSHRPVVDQSYQVALNLVFPSKQAQDDYPRGSELARRHGRPRPGRRCRGPA